MNTEDIIRSWKNDDDDSPNDEQQEQPPPNPVGPVGTELTDEELEQTNGGGNSYKLTLVGAACI